MRKKPTLSEARLREIILDLSGTLEKNSNVCFSEHTLEALTYLFSAIMAIFRNKTAIKGREKVIRELAVSLSQLLKSSVDLNDRERPTSDRLNEVLETILAEMNNPLPPEWFELFKKGAVIRAYECGCGCVFAWLDAGRKFLSCVNGHVAK